MVDARHVRLHLDNEIVREQIAFADVVVLNKIEWEDFRKNLIQSIGAWEGLDCEAQPPWDYYERFLLALVQVLEQHGVLSAAEIEQQTGVPAGGAARSLSALSSDT